MQNHYKTLGVKPDASNQQIKDAYRSKASRDHPDKQTGDEDVFKALQNAYAVLSDPKRREFYNKTGSEMKGSEFDRKAGALLQQLFQLIVTDNGLEAIIHLDIVSLMNNQIDKGMVELDKKIEHSKGSNAEMKKILKRLKHKNKMNPIALMLKHEMKKHSELITQKFQEKEVGERARKMLKEYGFDFDEQMKIANPYYGMKVSSSTVTFMGTS
jgi:curved DNA-binding protein CbpA